jgi:transposase-like protein
MESSQDEFVDLYGGIGSLSSTMHESRHKQFQMFQPETAGRTHRLPQSFEVSS